MASAKRLASDNLEPSYLWAREVLVDSGQFRVMLLSKLADMKVIAWPAFKTRYQNPYSWLLYSHMPEQVSVAEFSMRALLLNRFDVLHLHWPVETLVRHPSLWVARLRVLVFWGLLKLCKLRGTRVVWTIHDEKPHVVLHPALADWFTHRLVALTDGYINLCEAGQKAVVRSLPQLAGKPYFIVPHGHYRGYYADEISKAAAQSHLHLPANTTTLLYLGYISPYKNVTHLVEVFRELAKSSQSSQSVSLIVAGKPDDEAIETAIRTAAEDSPNVQLHLRFIQDDELQIFFKAADWVVLPFKEILNSGSLLLSLSFDRPVIAPYLGAVIDWQQQLGPSWVKTYTGALTADVLQTAIEDERPTGHAPLAALSWDVIAQQTLAAYESLS